MRVLVIPDIHLKTWIFRILSGVMVVMMLATHGEN